MQLAVTTPALLFPAISLLLLAYTSRFLALGQLIRGLSQNAQSGKVYKATKQIKNLKKRIELIKWMQLFGASALLLCTVSMFLIFLEYSIEGQMVFAVSLASMAISLIITLTEVAISSNALNIELEGIKKNSKDHKEHKDDELINSIKEEIQDKEEKE
ncbi:MAG: DUF2721 domain-containing protein [Campylobacteraceae bacterium]|nr:DUF2721 domain-containing protein [Campylobacteraceae bacterium]